MSTTDRQKVYTGGRPNQNAKRAQRYATTHRHGAHCRQAEGTNPLQDAQPGAFLWPCLGIGLNYQEVIK